MKKSYILVAIILIALFLMSIFYLWSDHPYELSKLSEIKTDENFIGVSFNIEENVLSNDVLGILKIEKIGLNATVKEGSTSEILKDYIGHIEKTSKYDGNIRPSST